MNLYASFSAIKIIFINTSMLYHRFYPHNTLYLHINNKLHSIRKDRDLFSVYLINLVYFEQIGFNTIYNLQL